MTDKEKSSDASGAKGEEGVLVYEFAYHLLPTLSEEETVKEVETFKSLIQSNGGSLVSDEAPRSMDLAYTMIKKQEGKNAKFDTSFFGWIKFEMKAEGLAPLKEEVDLNKNVLRYLLIKTVREYAPLQHKQLFRQVEEEEIAKPISKPEVVEKDDAKPISEAELDKTIEELVAEEK